MLDAHFAVAFDRDDQRYRLRIAGGVAHTGHVRRRAEVIATADLPVGAVAGARALDGAVDRFGLVAAREQRGEHGEALH